MQIVLVKPSVEEFDKALEKLTRRLSDFGTAPTHPFKNVYVTQMGDDLWVALGTNSDRDVVHVFVTTRFKDIQNFSIYSLRSDLVHQGKVLCLNPVLVDGDVHWASESVETSGDVEYLVEVIRDWASRAKNQTFE